ncbi:MAG: hypothetical protein R3247_07230 [Rhodothermales bacterium]|nr:hypothetical protein [Rhodothermales bacterium]
MTLLASRRAALGGVLLLAALVAACDTAPGPEPLDRRPPTLTDFAFAPQRVVFGLLPPEQIDGDSVRIPLSLAVTASSPDVPIAEVRYVVQAPGGLAEPLATGTLRPTGQNRYEATRTVSLPAIEPTTYTVLVYAVDQAERLSGEARGQLTYVRQFEPGSPPVIDAVEAPDTITRPAPGEPAIALSIVAVVSDADGLGTVEKVEFWNVNTPNQRIPLCDDGGGLPCGPASSSGDATAADGRYTQTVFLTSDNAAGTNTFAFQATDRSGLTSAVVEKTITVE